MTEHLRVFLVLLTGAALSAALALCVVSVIEGEASYAWINAICAVANVGNLVWLCFEPGVDA